MLGEKVFLGCAASRSARARVRARSRACLSRRAPKTHLSRLEPRALSTPHHRIASHRHLTPSERRPRRARARRPDASRRRRRRSSRPSSIDHPRRRRRRRRRRAHAHDARSASPRALGTVRTRSRAPFPPRARLKKMCASPNEPSLERPRATTSPRRARRAPRARRTEKDDAIPPTRASRARVVARASRARVRVARAAVPNGADRSFCTA